MSEIKEGSCLVNKLTINIHCLINFGAINYCFVKKKKKKSVFPISLYKA